MVDDVTLDVPMESYPSEPKVSPAMLELAKKIQELREKHTDLKTKAAKIWFEKEQLETNLIEQMQILKLDSFKHSDLGLFYLSRKVHGKIIDLDRAKEYFDREGLTDQILELRLKASPAKGIPGGQGRLNELIKEHLNEGKSLPEGIDYTSKATINRRSK